MKSTQTAEARLTAFIASYRAAQSNPENAWLMRMGAFFKIYRQIQPTAPTPKPTPPLIDHHSLSAVLETLRGPLADASAAGALLNPWVMAGLGRNEIRNTAVLAKFFSPRSCGQLAIDFINAFLEPLRPHPNIPSQDELNAGYHVRTEHYAAGNGRDRVDLTIEGVTFVIGIEVKIDASEGPEQLNRYVETIRQWGERRRAKSIAVIFLAPFPAGNSDVISVDWRSIAAASQKVVARSKADRTETQKLLHHFSCHVANL